MKLLEYEAKNILAAYGIPVPRGTIVRTVNDPLPAVPVVVKSQVPVGGRGKVGGVRVITESAALKPAINDILKLNIRGYVPTSLLCEEVLDIAQEYYLSLVIDYSRHGIEVIAHTSGGINIETHVIGEFFKHSITPETIDQTGESLAEYYNLPDKTFVLQTLLKQLYDCFIASDATLLEINPLILTADGRLVASDCKMILDNAAAFRHTDWKFEGLLVSTNFVSLDANGDVATIANGAGLAMSTVDAAKNAGLEPANFLDVGGGASVDAMLAAFHNISNFHDVKAIIINIFAGITRCDDVARAIIAARKEVPNLPRLFIRLAGTNSVEALGLLKAEGIDTEQSLEDCIISARSFIL